MRYPKLAFKNKPVPEQLVLARRVAECIAAEPSLAGTVTRLGQLQAALAEADTAAVAAELARSTWQSAVTRRNQLMRDLQRMTRMAAQELHSKGATEAELLQAGLDLTKPRTPIGALPMPTGVRAVTGTQAGTIKVRWDLIALRGTVYLVEQRDEPNGAWKYLDTVTRRQCGAKELEPGRQYWFRVASLGTAGQGPWSQAASARAA